MVVVWMVCMAIGRMVSVLDSSVVVVVMRVGSGGVWEVEAGCASADSKIESK